MASAKKPKPVPVPPPKLVQKTLSPGYTRYFPLGLFLLGFLLYANTFGHQYALDDAIVIYDNEFTKKGIEGIPSILKYDTFRGFFKVEGKEQLVPGGRYRPLTLVIFALEVELFGEKPFVGHLINALLFGLLVMLIYKLVLLFFAKAKPEKARWIALATSLLFAVHPVHTEAVANIKGADEMVTMLGGLAAIYFSMRAFDRKKWAGHILAGFLFFLGLLAKENAITLVAVVPLAYYFFRDVPLLKTVAPLLPFLAATAVFLAIRGAVLGWDLGKPPMELMNNPFLKLEDNRWVPFNAGEKMATILYTLGKYIQLLFFPYPLTHDYYPQQIPLMTFAHPGALASALLYLILLGYALWGLIKKKAMSFGVWFFLLTLSIVSNIVFPIGTNMGERFIFMPSLGFCLVIAMALSQWMERSKSVAPVVTWAGVAVLVAFSFLTVVRNMVWKDNYTLFTTDVKTSVNSAKLQNSAGGETIAYALTLGNQQARNAQLEKAVGHLKEAIRIHPTYKNAFLLLGNAHNYLKRFDESIGYYDIALKIDPNYAEAIRNRAVTFRDAGRYAGETERNPVKAETYLKKALELLPNDYETLRLLGVASGVQGRHQEAIQYFSLAMQVDPGNADAWADLSAAHRLAGNLPEATQCEQKALKIDPQIFQKRSTRQ